MNTVTELALRAVIERIIANAIDRIPADQVAQNEQAREAFVKWKDALNRCDQQAAAEAWLVLDGTIGPMIGN